MLDVDEGGHSALALRLGDDVLAEGGLARRLGTEDLRDPASRDAADAEGQVERDGARGNEVDLLPGGRALKFYASVRLDIRRVETIKNGTESVGNRVRVKVVKNKVAPPFRVAEFDVMYGEGVSREGGLLDVGVAMDVVTKTGAWFTYGETRLGQGREAAKEFLKSNAPISTEIESQIRTRMATASLPVEGIEEAE